jgi:hypothetical protein
MKRHILVSLLITLAFVMILSVISESPGQEKVRQEPSPGEIRDFTIARLVVGTGVENREPVGVAESFPASTERVYCFLEAVDIVKDTEVSFVWYLDQNELLTFNLPLEKGARWRTFAFKNLHGQKGDWKVEIRDEDGKPLKEVKFKVE